MRRVFNPIGNRASPGRAISFHVNQMSLRILPSKELQSKRQSARKFSFNCDIIRHDGHFSINVKKNSAKKQVYLKKPSDEDGCDVVRNFCIQATEHIMLYEPVKLDLENVPRRLHADLFNACRQVLDRDPCTSHVPRTNFLHNTYPEPTELADPTGLGYSSDSDLCFAHKNSCSSAGARKRHGHHEEQSLRSRLENNRNENNWSSVDSRSLDIDDGYNEASYSHQVQQKLCCYRTLESELDQMKAAILCHEFYPRLVASFIEYHKTDAPTETLLRLNRIQRLQLRNWSPIASSVSSTQGDEKRLYFKLLTKYQDQLEQPFQDATAFSDQVQQFCDSIPSRLGSLLGCCQEDSLVIFKAHAAYLVWNYS